MSELSFEELLESVGWTNKELAVRLGVTVTTVSRWRKSGTPPKYVMSYLETVNQLIGKTKGESHG